MDAFFGKSGGFKGAKCKTLLKLTIPRIKLLRNRREIQLKQMRKDIAKLLENGQEATARIRVEHIIREENMMAAQEILELFCELIAVRLPIIETQRECPLDLKEAISSICFAALRCSDLPELQQVQMLFAAKYGKEFVAAASELMPDCGVNRQVIELLSIRAPSVETKLKLLKEIAEEHELDWDPAASETEFFKPHEDLLNGPNHFVSASSLPLPKAKHDDSLASKPAEAFLEEHDLDEGFDSLDLPEVPKVSVQAAPAIPSAPEITPPLPASPQDFGHNDVIPKAAPEKEDLLHFHGIKPGEGHESVTSEKKQFVPFVTSPTFPSVEHSGKQSEPVAFASTSFRENKSEPMATSLARAESEANVDLQDVLAAAHAAAESAERAAASARTAASLAQVRITELISKKNNKIFDNPESEAHGKASDQVDILEKPTFSHLDSSSHINHSSGVIPTWGAGSPTPGTYDVPTIESQSPGLKEQDMEQQVSHVPQRSTSLEDDPYFSYPNLFRSDSNLKSGVSSSAENSRSDHVF